MLVAAGRTALPPGRPITPAIPQAEQRSSQLENRSMI